MTTPAELGFVEPVGTDMVSTGDDDISKNARAAAAMYDKLKNERRFPVFVPAGSNMNSFTRPDWYRITSQASTLLNRPQGFSSPFEWVTSEVGVNNTDGMVTLAQVARMPMTGSDYGKVAVRYGLKASTTTTFGQWQMEHGFMTLVAGDNLDNWKHPTQLEATTQAIAKTIVNRPPGFDNQFVIFTYRAGTTIFQSGICWDAGGVKTALRRSQGGVFNTPWIDTSPPVQRNDTYMAVFGDSQADGTWEAAAAAFFPDHTIIDHAAGGDNCQTMMIRNGWYQPVFQVIGGSIPASGAVNLTSSADWELRDNRAFAIGTIAGITGSLTHVAGNQFTFTRSTDGTATPAPDWQKFTATGRITTASQFIWVEVGGNNFNEDSKRTFNNIADLVLATYREVYDWCIANNRTPIFAGVSNRLTAVTGSDGFEQVKRITSELRRLYPNAFIDKQSYLSEYAIYDAGFTPTTADLEAMQLGEIPPQLYLDGDAVHFKPEVYAAFGAHRAAPWLAARGYFNTTAALNPLRELHPKF